MILVTGASGMIGRALVQQLVDAGARVRVALRNTNSGNNTREQLSRDHRIEIFDCDFSKASERQLLSAAKGCASVIHLAGLVHQPHASTEQHELLNFDITRRLADAARSEGVGTFVFASTVAVYGAPPLEEVTEDAPVNPDTDYGKTKLRSEKYLAQAPPAERTIIVRPSLVYGPGDRGNMISLIKQVLRGRYFHIGAAQARKSLIFSEDCARAIILCLEKSPEGVEIYNVANPVAPTVREIGDTIAQAGALPTKLPTIPEIIVRTGSYASLVMGGRSPLPPSKLDKLTRSSSCSVAKLQQITGFEPRYTLLEGIQAEIQWYSAAGSAPNSTRAVVR